MPLGALVPSFLGLDWWDTWDYPSRISDQCFGVHVPEDDLLPASLIRGYWMRPRSQTNICSSGQSEVINDDKKFEVSLNVSQFKPEEITVKGVNDFIVIHGVHEERKEEKGDNALVKREFTRRYMLPKACNIETVSSAMTPEGILTITAPKRTVEAKKKEKDIPVKVGSETPVKGKKKSTA